ncbi:MAG: RNA polymerase sigma factor SigJ [Pseudonocardiaceae bacterium]
MTTDATHVFEQHRSLLTGLAYRVIGQVSDAEDVVLEAWLRWTGADHSTIAQPRAYLLQVVTRLAIDRLRRVAARRETYVGPWLPEPLLTEPDVADRAELIDSISIAMLVVLETLSPLERAVFVLHEAFGFSHPEIAVILQRKEPAVRQLARRAHDHVRARRPRYDTDRVAHTEVTERFLTACERGDLGALLTVLAPDVVLIGDGGGIGRAPRRPIHGAGQVARFLIGLNNTTIPDISTEITSVNAGSGIVVRSGATPLAMFALDIADGLVRTIHAIANPDKLTRL